MSPRAPLKPALLKDINRRIGCHSSIHPGHACDTTCNAKRSDPYDAEHAVNISIIDVQRTTGVALKQKATTQVLKMIRMS
ncbi:hypothetical protein EVAR_97788_1 [Eumeta japonica]|uniref:Uncharacterized protein n=1 Tax=Eumeta variegata TaxID=151549 RepID=A0A4C1XEB7_EUMVA|nr:hypothetical protein EVAR_97788_1 [Eumeta japonica]